jgi:hypothetical protein
MGFGVPTANRRLITRRIGTLAAVVALCAPVQSQATIPVLSSGNLSVAAIVADPGAIGGRIVGDTLYTTSASGLRIYDLSLDGIPVLQASVPIPTYQNEDLDVAGGIALLSSDFLIGSPRRLTVVDVSNPLVAVPAATISVPAAHTASCILECSFAWLGGSNGRVHVVDLRDPAAPVVLGNFLVPGLVHDVQVDSDGLAWVSTGAGLFVYRPTQDPLNPHLELALQDGEPGAFENDFILHNSLRVSDDTVFVVEEDWDPLSNDLCANDGAFQSGEITQDQSGRLRVRALDRFSIGQGELGDTDRLPGAPVSCSAHYFDVRADGVATVAWYEQGVRILDTSDPTNLREIGYAIGPGETITTLIRGDLIYAFDTVQGLVVLRLAGGPEQATLNGPVVATDARQQQPNPEWGFACRLPSVAA